MKKFIFNFTAAAALCCSASAAHAVTGYCNDGGIGLTPIQSDGLAVTDMTYRGNDATNCYGVVGGNDSKNVLNAGSGYFNINTWERLVKFDADNDSASGTSFTGAAVDLGIGIFTFTLTYNGLSGGLHQYELSATPLSGLPIVLDLVGVIKQGSGSSGGGFATYFFDDALIGKSGNVGTFLTSFGPGTNGFSHFGFYGTNAMIPPPPPDDLPEPGTLALLGLGLVGLGIARRRKA